MNRDYPALSLTRNRLVAEPAQGECHIRRQSDGDDQWLEVIHADPHILISDEVLNTIAVYQECGVSQLGVQLSPPPNRPPCEGDACPHVPCWTQWILHIAGRSRTVIYRIGRWNTDLQAWEAAWPD